MKIKNIIFTLALVATLGATYGNPIDLNQAKQVANTFASTISDAKSDLNLVYTATNATEDVTYYYVFNTQEGFVMVAGDDQVSPILGYSTEGQFISENMPTHMAAYFNELQNTIDYIVNNNIPCTQEITKEWKELLSGNVSVTKGTNVVTPLLKDSWGQGATGSRLTYNAKCPKTKKGEPTVTGCMATTLSQIIRYNQYPTKGFGSFSYSTTDYGTLSANFANTTYDFANMPDKLTTGQATTDAQINAVSTLMYHCGVAVEMDYGTANGGGSGALLEENVERHSGEFAIKNYFGYPNATVIYIETLGKETFLNRIITDLDKGYPVAITGNNQAQNAGHIFTCDGYDASKKLHFNWGWDGANNGYYALGSMKVDKYDFSYYNSALVNLIPMSKLQEASLVLTAKPTSSKATVPCGTAFTYTVSLANKGTKAFSGKIRAFIAQGLMQYTSTASQIGSDVTKTINAGATVSVTFSSDGVTGFAAGQQPIMVEYQPTGSSSWVRVGGINGYLMPSTQAFSGETTIKSTNPYNITGSTVTMEAIINPGCATIASRGFEYKEATAATYKTTYETSNTMKKTITGLKTNTKYMIRIWALMNGQRQYTNPVTFTTKSSGIEDIYTGDVAIYPNPAKENLNIDLSDSEQNISKVELINSLGQTMYLINTPANTLYTIPTAQFANGLYFIRLSSDNGVMTKKVLISK